jgi:Helix-turn-helix domain
VAARLAGLRLLLVDGTLVPGASPSARLRVAGAGQGGGAYPEALRLVLLAALAARRHAEGLTQPQLATLLGVSATTVGHAETGRLWQRRGFWQRTDRVLGTGGTLAGLYDGMLAAAACPAPEDPPEPPRPVILPACVVITAAGVLVTRRSPSPRGTSTT